MNKKLITLISVLALILPLAACGGGNTPSQPSTQISTAQDNLQQNNAPILSAADYETEEIELAYSVPELLENELGSFVLEIEGDLYRLPAPMSAFLENGWEIAERSVDFIDANSSSTNAVDLTKNDKTIFDADLINFDKEAKPIEECYVYGIFVGKTYTFGGENARSGDIGLILPGGAAIGTSADEVTNIYKDMISSGDLYIRIDNDDILVYEYLGLYGRNIQLYISKETNAVTQIQIQNDSSQNLK